MAAARNDADALPGACVDDLDALPRANCHPIARLAEAHRVEAGGSDALPGASTRKLDCDQFMLVITLVAQGDAALSCFAEHFVRHGIEHHAATHERPAVEVDAGELRHSRRVQRGAADGVSLDLTGVGQPWTRSKRRTGRGLHW